jgi:hypothetical protein
VQLRHNDQEKQLALSKVLGENIQIYTSLQSKKEKANLLGEQVEVLQRRLLEEQCQMI